MQADVADVLLHVEVLRGVNLVAFYLEFQQSYAVEPYSVAASCAHAPVMPRIAASVKRNLFVAFIVYLFFYLLLFMFYVLLTIHETKRIQKCRGSHVVENLGG